MVIGACRWNLLLSAAMLASSLPGKPALAGPADARQRPAGVAAETVGKRLSEPTEAGQEPHPLLVREHLQALFEQSRRLAEQPDRTFGGRWKTLRQSDVAVSIR